MMTRCLTLFLCLITLIGCAPAAAVTFTPIPPATVVPTMTLPPVPPDICAETNNTYRLVPGSYYVQPSAASTAIPSALPSLTSPDGNYSVQQVANDLVLHPENGGDDIVLAPAPDDGYVIREYV